MLEKAKRGDIAIHRPTYNAMVEKTRSGIQFDSQFFRTWRVGEQEAVSFRREAIEFEYDGPFSATIKESTKLKIREGHITYRESTKSLTQLGGTTYTEDDAVYEDWNLGAEADGWHYLIATIVYTQSTSQLTSYSWRTSTMWPAEYPVSGETTDVIERVIGAVRVASSKIIEWWQIHYANVFLGGAGGGTEFEVENRWYAYESVSNYQVTEDESELETAYVLAAGAFWHSIIELDTGESPALLINHKYQRCEPV